MKPRGTRSDQATEWVSPRRAVRWRLLAALVMVCLVLPAVAGPRGSKSAKAKVRQETAGEDLEPLRMNTDMARFLSKQVRTRLDRQARVQYLLDSIFDKKALGITYGNQRTKTAIETFESGSGNCLSFTMLFVVMARHVGLAAYFQEVDEVVSWDRRGEIVLTQQHMFAEVEFDNGVVQVDFLPGAEKRYRRVRRISDKRALAHFYNNLGVEALADDRTDDAIAWIEQALGYDEKFSSAWSNLGVVQRRLGDAVAAEQSYLRAIDAGPTEVALNNLTSLYLDLGRHQEAQPLLDRSKDYLQRNPYHHFRLAGLARQQGQPQDAVKHLRQALRRHDDEAVFHATLGEVLSELGERKKAIESFKNALRLADDDDSAVHWQEQLDALVEAAAQHRTR